MVDVARWWWFWYWLRWGDRSGGSVMEDGDDGSGGDGHNLAGKLAGGGRRPEKESREWGLASSTLLMQRIISSPHAEFAVTDLGPLNYFLSISAMRTTSGIFLSQMKYAIEIFERA
nr:ribonuclease H-like domain-containing protein [Tanacetum cinerariifolium]